MQPRDHERYFQPARLMAVAFLVLAATASAGSGVLLGGTLQERLEAGPDAAQVRTLDALDRPQPSSPSEAADPRGPNRADLGGGRADLGADR